MTRTTGPVPLYFRIQVEIRRRIEDGELKPGDPLPTEEQLCQEFGVSRITVRRAMDALSARGLVSRRQGIGSFVSQGPSKAVMLTGVLEEVLAPAVALNQRVLQRTVEAPPEDVALALRLEPNVHVTVFETLHAGKEGPFSFARLYVPNRYAASVDEAKLITTRPAVHIADVALGKYLTRAEQSIDADVASRRIAELLELRQRAPLLRVTRTYFVSDDLPITTVIAWYHPERFRYMVRLLPGGLSRG